MGVLIEQLYDFLRGLGNSFDVLQCLRREAHHKVQLHRGIARIKCDVAGLFNFIPGDVLVDHVPQALCTRLRGKGQAAFTNLCGLLNQALAEIVHTQAGQRNGYVLLLGPGIHLIQ